MLGRAPFGIQAGAVSTSELAAGAVNASKIAANTITASQIAANTITAGQNFTVQVNVAANGTVTYLWGDNNGVLIPPANLATPAVMGALTFIPWMHFKQAAGAFDEVDIVSYSCGLL